MIGNIYIYTLNDWDLYFWCSKAVVVGGLIEVTNFEGVHPNVGTLYFRNSSRLQKEKRDLVKY